MPASRGRHDSNLSTARALSSQSLMLHVLIKAFKDFAASCAATVLFSNSTADTRRENKLLAQSNIDPCIVGFLEEILNYQ